MTTMKKAFCIFICALFIFSLASCDSSSNIICIQSDIMSYDEAIEKLNIAVSEIKTETPSVSPGTVNETSSSVEEKLPDINISYPYVVEGSKDSINIEILSSTEKAGENKNGWLREIAQRFNSHKLTINGTLVSVSLRSVPSGEIASYINTGKHIPDAITPSNQLWGEMIKSVNKVSINLEAEKLAGNVTGIVMSNQKYNEFTNEYGEVTIANVIKATLDGNIKIGYTNPFGSSTGLNFLLSALVNFDGSNPLSDKAIASFEEFQTKIPIVYYTTMQMQASVTSGKTLDGMTMEYQTFVSTNELKDYIFTPFGARHDSPMYSIGTLSSEKQQILDMFVDFCLNQDSQSLATQYGFNNYESYTSALPSISGDVIKKAQTLWKEKKDGGNTIVSMFVADTSGSMIGKPIANLKTSLKDCIDLINSDYYIGLIDYDSNIRINVPIAKFDSNQKKLFAGAVGNFEASGSTYSYNAMAVALKQLIDAKQTLISQGIDGDTIRLRIFLLSDGQPSDNIRGFTDMVRGLEIPIYTIGYNANLSELQNLANINEAANINADSDDVNYKLASLFSYS